MSVPDDPFDFATLLRREAVRNEPALPADNRGLAPALSKPPLQPSGSERAAVTRRADTLAPDPVPRPTDATARLSKIAAPTALSVTYKRLTTLWPPSFRLPRAPDAPLFGIISGSAAFVLIVGTVIVSLVQHVAPRTSDLQTDSSGALKLASVNSQRVEPPATQESAPAAGSSSAIAPASLRDIADPESKVQGSSEVNPAEGVAPVVPASVKTLASPANAPPSELPKLAAMYSQPVAAQPIPLPPIPPAPLAAQRSASRAATETTASLSPSAPASEPAAALPRAEATQPQGDNASRRKRDQKPGTAAESPVPPAAQRGGASPPRAATEATASIAPSAPSSETKAALPRAEATQPHIDGAAQRKRDQKQATAGETPIPPVPPAAQRGTPPSRAATDTTASVSPSAPSSDAKATAARADAAQPHIDDASQRKRDQKPGNAAVTSSCTADVIPGSVRASARAKSGQADVQKVCSDPNVPFTVSVRCLVAAVVCSDYPSEKHGTVAQKATPPNRAPSHTAADTKPETKPDTKPQ